MTLSLDQSLTKTAAIVFNEKNEIEYFTVIKTSTRDGTEEERIVFLLEELEKIILEWGVVKIVLEDLLFNVVSRSVRVLAGVFYNILTLCVVLGLDYEKISATKAKKRAGSGRNGKEEMIKALPEDVRFLFSKEYKITTGLHDLADAYFIYFSSLK